MTELFDGLGEPQETWEQKAQKYIRENPDTIRRMAETAIYYRRHGQHRGMKYIAEQYRYVAGGVATKEKYRWNNNYTAFVARHLMDTVPELRDYFELRHQSPKTRKVLA